MIGELSPNVSVAMRAMAAVYRRQFPDLAADASAQERAVIDSGLDWTVVKPPRLTSGGATHRVRADRAQRVGLLSRVSRADLAAFMLDEASAGRHIRERVYVRS
jgi:putative NADH-flavin reductase